jgi:hypothetical protein
MFIAALFTISILWKQSRCPTTNERIKKSWYLHIMEFYSTTKKNEILSFLGKWMELDNKNTHKKRNIKKKKWADGLSREFSKEEEQMANKYMNKVLKFPGTVEGSTCERVQGQWRR